MLLSATFFGGACAEVLDRCILRPDIDLLSAEHILAEYLRHASARGWPPRRPPGSGRGGDDRVPRFSEIVTPIPVDPGDFDDPDDLPVLGAAVAGCADALVTGDKGLLTMKDYRGISIVSPRNFLNDLTA